MSDEVGKAWREYMAVPHERFASERREGFLAGWRARDAEVAELREAFEAADSFAKVNAMNAADYFFMRDEVASLRQQLAAEQNRIASSAYVGRLMADHRQQLDARDAVIERVRAEADKAEQGALRWADPLPVPEWVERVRTILDAVPVSVLAEHDARVLEEAADDWGSQIRNGGAGSWLRERAAERRKGAGQ